LVSLVAFPLIISWGLSQDGSGDSDGVEGFPVDAGTFVIGIDERSHQSPAGIGVGEMESHLTFTLPDGSDDFLARKNEKNYLVPINRAVGLVINGPHAAAPC